MESKRETTKRTSTIKRRYKITRKEGGIKGVGVKCTVRQG